MLEVKQCTSEEANGFIRCLVGQQLNYGFKFADMDLYILGFADKPVQNRTECAYTIHHTTGMEVYWKDKKKRVVYDWDTPQDVFHTDMQELLGLSIKRVALSDKNDFWLDLGVCYMVICTPEDGEESWRLLTPNKGPHLVASDLWMETHSLMNEEDSTF